MEDTEGYQMLALINSDTAASATFIYKAIQTVRVKVPLVSFSRIATRNVWPKFDVSFRFA